MGAKQRSSFALSYSIIDFARTIHLVSFSDRINGAAIIVAMKASANLIAG